MQKTRVFFHIPKNIYCREHIFINHHLQFILVVKMNEQEILETETGKKFYVVVDDSFRVIEARDISGFK